jgi:hypothetical protein
MAFGCRARKGQQLPYLEATKRNLTGINKFPRGMSRVFNSYLGAVWQCGETRNDVGTRVRRASLAGRMATDKYEKKDKKTLL